MLDDRVKERLNQLTDLELIHSLAFKRREYRPDSYTYLRKLLRERGYEWDVVGKYKEAALKIEEMESECTECGEKLVLDREDLLRGEFECPECYARQRVRYPQLSPYVEFLDGEEATVETATEPQPVPDEIGQETEAAPGSMAEEKTGQVCADCGKELSFAEMFAYGGEFLCEKCHEVRRREGERPQQAPPEPVIEKPGIRGWLALLAASLVLKILVTLTLLIFDPEFEYPRLRAYGIAYLAGLVFLVAQLLLKRRTFVLNYTIYVISSVGIWIVAIAMACTGGAGADFREPAMKALTDFVVSGVFWIFYLHHSYRVKLTLVR